VYVVVAAPKATPGVIVQVARAESEGDNCHFRKRIRKSPKMYSPIIFIALFAYASAQTFGQLKTCFKSAHETCSPGCQKSSNISQTFLDKMKACAESERNATVTAVQACTQKAGVTINESTLCWARDHAGNWTGPGKTENPPAHPALKAYHVCMFQCVKNEECMKPCTAPAPTGKDALRACHRTAEQTAKPAFIACLKAGASPS